LTAIATTRRLQIMHPSQHAASHPHRPAIIAAADGRVVSYDELDRQSNRVAQLLRARGLAAGDVVAIQMENRPLYYALTWGAQRAGLYFVCMSTRLTTAESRYMIADSGAGLLLTSAAMNDVARDLADLVPILTVDAGDAGFDDLGAALAAMPDTPIADQRAGTDMLYSSGTTGRPKGIRVALPDDPDIAATTVLEMLARGLYGFGEDMIYLSPSPLYHAAPLRWSMTVHRVGGTVVLMEHYDAEAALAAIERYRVTHAQFVPTHFVRMLKLPEAARARYDVTSMTCAIHAAAPCPIAVKRAMIDWWGPVIYEYYAGSEGNGMTAISAPEWLERPGSVGRAMHGIVHICDDDGHELPVGETALVYFESPTPFAYHNDPEKTAQSQNAQGWSTLGDVGRLDADGYLTLTDRKSYMIISGGVNIYPREIEDRIVIHPKVADVAVIGIADDDMGEKVIAVVEPAHGVAGDAALASELDAWCRAELAGFKVPRRFDFRAELPRHPTGKLYKRVLVDEYRARKTA